METRGAAAAGHHAHARNASPVLRPSLRSAGLGEGAAVLQVRRVLLNQPGLWTRTRRGGRLDRACTDLPAPEKELHEPGVARGSKGEILTPNFRCDP